MPRLLDLLKRFKRGVLNRWRAVQPIGFYASHGEDRHIDELLRRFGIGPSGGFDYMDVGANQPAIISNTFRMYRQGFRGVLVEPNPELAGLIRGVRPRDALLAIGCGERAGVAGISVAGPSVLASLTAPRTADTLIPVLTIDQICDSLDIRGLAVLSIDVEGMNREVLAGARGILPRTRIAIVECIDAPESAAAIAAELTAAGLARQERVGHNIIAVSDRN